MYIVILFIIVLVGVMVREKIITKKESEKTDEFLADDFLFNEEIITKRPENMVFSTYKRLLKEQNIRLKNKIKFGILIYISCYIVETGGKMKKYTKMPYYRKKLILNKI